MASCMLSRLFQEMSHFVLFPSDMFLILLSGYCLFVVCFVTLQEPQISKRYKKILSCLPYLSRKMYRSMNDQLNLAFMSLFFFWLNMVY